MRTLLLTLSCICLLSVSALAQTESPGGMVVFETFGSGTGTGATLAGVLSADLTTESVIFAAAGTRLSRNVGLAIVNPGSTSTSVTLTLRRGNDGTTNSVRTITIGAREQVSRFISELFADVSGLPLEFDGSLKVVSADPIAIIGLRFRGPVFSTIPVTSLRDATPLPQFDPGVGGRDAVILPQFASGGGWSSEIVISNTSPVPMGVRVDLFKQNGTALTTTFNGQSASSFTGMIVPAEGILILSNVDNGPQQVGYAIVTALDTLSPTVTSTSPQNADSGVRLNRRVIATFSESMDPSTINASTFKLNAGTFVVSGEVSYSGNTATFKPDALLDASTAYSATITTGARDIKGNSLENPFVWTFVTTGAASGSDTNAPEVSATAPQSNASAVPINQKVSATFNEAMDPATINTSTFTLKAGSLSVTGSVDHIGNTATFTPTVNLFPNTTYTATITTGAQDLAGNALSSDYVWLFSTGGGLDTVAPVVTSTDPLNGATNVPVNQRVAATFSEAMDPLTVTTATFTLMQGQTSITGTVTSAGSTAQFSPNVDLTGSTVYTATITTGAKDLSGNRIVSNFAWTFTTAAVVAAGPGSIALGAASPYGILAGAGVTNSGATTIIGSLGTSPTGTLTGAPVVTGSIDLANPAAAAAKLALTAAYNEAAGRVVNVQVLPGDLSGLTFAPGLYKNSTSVMLSTGNFTLDAQGDPNATWIFQMGSTLTTIGATQIVLANGAKAANVYWQVGSSATLGTTSIFKGNILASISISVNTGAVVEGRLLTQTGAVSLLSNQITVPNP